MVIRQAGDALRMALDVFNGVVRTDLPAFARMAEAAGAGSVEVVEVLGMDWRKSD